jgi:hypothetical protein
MTGRYGALRSGGGALRRLGAAAAGLLLLVGAQAQAGHPHSVYESVEVSDLYQFNTETKVNGAVILVRDFNNNVVDVSLSTSALQPGYAFSIWIAVFNNPGYCSQECSTNDLPGVDPSAAPRVKATVFYGGGYLDDSAGNAKTAYKIVPGRTNRELFAPAGTRNFGLQRLWGSEIHIVLRTHGEAWIGNVATQIGTASGACNPDMTACANKFASFHPPRD